MSLLLNVPLPLTKWPCSNTVVKLDMTFNRIASLGEEAWLIGVQNKVHELWKLDERDNITRFGGRIITSINTSETTSTVVSEDGRCFAWGDNINFEFNSITHCYLDKPVKIRLNLPVGKGFPKLVFPSDDLVTMKPNEQNFRKLVKAGSKADYSTPMGSNSALVTPSKILFRNVWSRGGGLYFTGCSDMELFPGQHTLAELDGNKINPSALPQGNLYSIRLMNDIVGVSISKVHVLGWTGHGQLFSWGTNILGVLGVSNNQERINERVFKPERVEMGFGAYPGCASAFACNTASMFIDFRGKVYYWGKLYEDSPVKLVQADKLEIQPKENYSDHSKGIYCEPPEDYSKERIFKICGENFNYAAISTSAHVYISSETTGPCWEPFLAYTGLPVVDISLSTSSLRVLTSSTKNVIIPEAIHRFSELEIYLIGKQRLIEQEAISHRKRILNRKSKQMNDNLGRTTDSGFKDEISMPDLTLKKQVSRSVKNKNPKIFKTEAELAAGLNLQEGFIGVLKSNGIQIDSLAVHEECQNAPFLNRISFGTQQLEESVNSTMQFVNSGSLPVLGKHSILVPDPTIAGHSQESKLSLLQYTRGAEAKRLWAHIATHGGEKELVRRVMKSLLDKRTQPPSVHPKEESDQRFMKRKPMTPLGEVEIINDVGKDSRINLHNLERISQQLQESQAEFRSLLNLSDPTNMRKGYDRANRKPRKVDLIKSNIKNSSTLTADSKLAKHQNLANNLKNKIMALAQAKLDQKSPSWLETTKSETQNRSNIYARVMHERFMKKSRPILREVLRCFMMVTFMDSVQTLLDNIRSEEEIATLAPELKPAFMATPVGMPAGGSRNRSSRAMVRGNSNDMYYKYMVTSSMRSVLNHFKTTKLFNQVEFHCRRVTGAATEITKFGRKVLRRRLFEIGLLAAEFNWSVAQSFKHSGNDKSQNLKLSSMPLTHKLLQYDYKKLRYPLHHNKTFVWKTCLISRALNCHTSSLTEIQKLVEEVMLEMLPFSIHCSNLQFDRSFFTVKKLKITEEIIKQESTAKLHAITELYNMRNEENTNRILKYRDIIDQYILTNPLDVAKKRVEYTLLQGNEFLCRIKEFQKRNFDDSEGAPRKANRPFAHMAYSFAEELNQSLERPAIDLNFTRQTLVELLDHYNRSFKALIHDKPLPVRGGDHKLEHSRSLKPAKSPTSSPRKSN